MEQSATNPSLREALANVSLPQIGVRCFTCTVMDDMTPEDLQAFTEAMGNKSLSNNAIATALAAAGYKVSRGSLARHRRQECKPVQ